MAALGIHIGGYIHVLAAALGLAALFDLVPVLYTAMKYAGAAYLCWLGVNLLKGTQPTTTESPATGHANTFWQSALVEILNPKTAIFYVAFLPQFTDPSALLPLWGQLLLLGTIVNLMFSSADLLCVFLAERIKTAMQKSSTAHIAANRVGGSVLVALGAHLALSR